MTIREELEEYNKEVEELMREASTMNTKFRFDINTFFAWRASKKENEIGDETDIEHE